jgi:putative nucleotidyltransferase with HDIG domain
MLFEVGGMTALALAVAALVVGLMRMDGLRFTLLQAAYAALAGLGSGFIVLGVLPFIERVFHITTGMTLLEYQNHPLLRRLALEAPGTYNHSLQVASMAEEAAIVVEADALLCRVACYYHDIGKLRKPDYYIENQSSGENRHLNLNPNMSLMVILSHVKDGIEMAKEYGLPRAFVPFIREHHGTTLVEYFYREACQRQQQKLAEGHHDAGKNIEDCDFRYPGPSPRSRETAIVMMCDTCESACRAMTDPTPARIEGRVEDLFKKRLLDGQFDECPLTLRELDLVRKSITKSLGAIYHGRIQYPDDKIAPADAAPATVSAGTAGQRAG